MTIELGDGLQFPELLEVFRALNVTKLIDPGVRAELDDGVNAMLSLASKLQGVPWLLGILQIDSQLDGAVKALQLVKGLLEA